MKEVLKTYLFEIFFILLTYDMTPWIKDDFYSIDESK
jgi:hypothetical protein